MLDTVLFDLDGTLLPIAMSDFVAEYFRKLSAVLSYAKLDADAVCRAIRQGCDRMIQNDGTVPNCVVFWGYMKDALKLGYGDTNQLEELCERFYRVEFDSLKSLFTPTSAPAGAVNALREKGYTVVLATNPIFPWAAAATRLSWLGLKRDDFALVTDYANCGFCKPNPGYYRQILARIGKTAEQCLMVGNSITEDMSAQQLGMKTYLVTGYVEGGEGVDLTRYERGSIEDFARLAGKMPRVGRAVKL